MEFLIPIENFKNFKDIPCKCAFCKKTFNITKSEARRHIKGTRIVNCCSMECRVKLATKKQNVLCANCNKSFLKKLNECKKTKNNFCTRSCAAIYNNKNKTHGNRRSKLECWLEKKLNELYPNLEIHYNRKDAIKSELDIYIPSLKLGFELNGIFHYEPIFGKEKLKSIKNNDNRKFQACIEEGIELCIIDVSKLGYFKEKYANEFLNIILKIIESVVSESN